MSGLDKILASLWLKAWEESICDWPLTFIRNIWIFLDSNFNNSHCVKSVRIRIFFWPECGKIRPGKLRIRTFFTQCPGFCGNDLMYFKNLILSISLFKWRKFTWVSRLVINRVAKRLKVLKVTLEKRLV